MGDDAQGLWADVVNVFNGVASPAKRRRIIRTAMIFVFLLFVVIGLVTCAVAADARSVPVLVVDVVATDDAVTITGSGVRSDELPPCGAGYVDHVTGEPVQPDEAYEGQILRCAAAHSDSPVATGLLSC